MSGQMNSTTSVMENDELMTSLVTKIDHPTMVLGSLILAALLFTLLRWWTKTSIRQYFRPLTSTLLHVLQIANGHLDNYFRFGRQWEIFFASTRAILRFHQLRVPLDLEWGMDLGDLHRRRNPDPIVFIVPRPFSQPQRSAAIPLQQLPVTQEDGLRS
ncbi:hypothetical protein FRC02_003998 [Tulasnella sp. 418]|nr:hypothetical protein FRC02_003998 [Tulasnella sp. 418]